MRMVSSRVSPLAEAENCRLEGKPGAGRRLVEESRHDLAREATHEPVRLPLDLLRAREELFEERPTELLTLDHVAHLGRDCHGLRVCPGRGVGRSFLMSAPCARPAHVADSRRDSHEKISFPGSQART